MAVTPQHRPVHTPILDVRETGHATPLAMICFSHVRWGFVWQRPQHLLTRFAASHPVFVVEEPLLRESKEPPGLLTTKDAGVTILTPSLPTNHYAHGTFGPANNSVTRALLSNYFGAELVGSQVIAWYDSPMALDALPADIRPSLTIYDALDEYANRRGAPKVTRDQERRLMRTADLVFTAGPSLYDARKFRHPRTFCFPSGVEAPHFHIGAGSRPRDLELLTNPIIGYFGVLDDRIDFDLVGGIADARPDWSVAMIGPVINIDRSRLAHRPNIHYLGMKRYEELPRYLAYFDAGILPLLLNEATRFMSPSKTLEYLAGGKPVVATALDDVIELYEDVVEIATGPEEFVTAIERLRDASSEDKYRRSQRVNSVLEQHDWNVIAARVQRLMYDALNNDLTFEKVLREAAIRAIPNHAPSSA